MPKLYAALASLVLSLSCFQLNAQPIIGYQTIAATGLDGPIDIAIPPNASPGNGSTRIFVAQQNGLIRLWNGTSFADFLDITSLVSRDADERGLLSITFHPSYNGTTNRDFFVYYTNTGGDLTVARYQTQSGNPDAVDLASATVMINPIEHTTPTNHNGGDLNFGPDGFLYLSTGDGGGGGDPDENGQNPTTLLGKILRIDVDAAPPVTPTVVDIGLRNPFRWSFDATTGDAWIGDVGQGNWEEISFKPAGSPGLNFGWDCYEGNVVYEASDCLPASEFTLPSYVYANPSPNEPRSVIGGYVYRGTEFPELDGYYIATDYFTGIVYKHNGGTWYEQSPALQTGISSFGQAPDGTLYAVSQFSDDLYKVVVTGVLPVTLVSFSANRAGDVTHFSWSTASEQNTARFRVEYSKTASNFQTVGAVTAARSGTGSKYSFQHHLSTTENMYYRLAIEEDDGQVAYSSIIKLNGQKNGFRIYPTLIRNNTVTIELNQPATKMQLINSVGAVVFEKDLRSISGTASITLPSVPKGSYVVQVLSNSEAKKQKVIVD